MNNTELENMADKEREKQRNFRCRFFCCASTPCLSSGSAAVKAAISAAVAEQQLEDDPVATDRLSLWLKRARLM